MKRAFILILSLLICLWNSNNFSYASDNAKETQSTDISDILNFYRNYSKYTDPGKYAYLYKNLPESLNELCKLIKCQLIHPFEITSFSISPQRQHEYIKFPTVEKILAGLLELDPKGLTLNRKPENRLIIPCRGHSILLASILKYRQIPVRVRSGFASYLHYSGHVICEVWNSKEKRWMFVDPDRKMIDFPKNKFELGGDVWLRYQNNEIDHPEKYEKNRGSKTSLGFIMLDVLCHDMASVLGQELARERPPISHNVPIDVRKIEKEKLDILNKIAFLLKNPDNHLDEIKVIYKRNEFLQYNPVERKVVKVDPAIYNKYIGEYNLEASFMTVTKEGDRLFAQWRNLPKLEVFPASETIFFLKEVDSEIEFIKDDDGNVAYLLLRQVGLEIRANKIK